MTSAIPIIDVAGLSAGDPAALARIARELGSAARDVGFFYVVGHGIPAALRDAVFAASDAFFALPRAVKAELAIDRVGDNRGWIGLATEALDPTTAPDPKEAFNIGFDPPSGPERNAWPDLPGFRETMSAWWAAAFRLGVDLHRAVAVDLGAPVDTFETAFATPMSTLRLLHCPPSPRPVPRGWGPAPTPTTAISPSSSPTRSAASRCAVATAPGSRPRSSTAPSSSTSATA